MLNGSRTLPERKTYMLEWDSIHWNTKKSWIKYNNNYKKPLYINHSFDSHKKPVMKITVKYHYLPIRIAKLKKLKLPIASEDVEQ